MADRVWGAGSGAGTDGLWSTAANWTGDTKPTTGDNVIFNNGVVLNCTIDEATAELGNFTIGGTVTGIYSGTITASFKPQMTGNFVIEAGSTAVFDLNADMDVDGDFTIDGAGTFDCGAGTITIAGNFDNKDQTTWTRGTSTVVLSGTTKTMTGQASKTLYNLTISGTIEVLTTGYLQVLGDVSVTGTWTISTSVRVSKALSCTGTVNGAGSFIFVGNNTFSTMSGTWSPATTSTWGNMVFTATGTFGGNWTLLSVGTTTVTCGSGTRTFTGAVTFNDNGGIYTITGSANNPSWVFQGGVTFTKTGTLTWTKGTGTITFSGTGDQTITTPAGWTQVLEDIVIDKGSDTAKVLLAGNVYTDTLTCTRGRLDLDGKTIDSAGSVSCQTTGGFQFHNGTNNDMDGGIIDIAAGTLTLNGTAGTQLQINDLDFVVAAGVTCAPTYCTVKDSTVTGAGGPINASASATNVNDGGNIGWKISDAYFIGTIDNVCVFSSPLTDAKSDWLYNAGSPRTLRDMQLSNDTNNPGTTTLVALWKLNEASGATRNDSISTVHLSDVGTVASGTGKVVDYPIAAAGTVTGAGGVEDRARSSNGDGLTNYLSTGSGFNITDWPISISLWFKTSDIVAGTKTILSFSNNTANNYVTINCIVANGKTQAALQVGGAGVKQTLSDAATSFNGAYHHWLLVITSTQVKGYYDGVATTPAAHTYAYPSLTQGKLFRIDYGALQGYNGIADSIAIFNADKSASAATLYNGGAGLDFDEHDALGNLVHFWSLSKNNPGGIGEDLKGTLDLTQTGTTVDAVGIPAGQNPIGTVYQWTDSGPNAYHATQATLSKRPTLVEALDGVYEVKFDGVDDYLYTATATYAQPNTIICVPKFTDAAGSEMVCDGDTGTRHAVYAATTAIKLYAGAEATVSTATRGTSREIWSMVFNQASSTYHKNGTPYALSGTVGTDSLDGLYLGAACYISTYFNGNLGDFVIYSGALAAATHNAIGQYLATKYGLSWTTIT